MAFKATKTALAILCLASFAAHATDGHPTLPNTPLPDFTDKMGDMVTRQMMDWMQNDGDDYPSFTDQEYSRRLVEMSGAIEYRLHPMVKEVIVARTEKYRSSTEEVLGLSDVYFAIFEEHLAKYDVPHHLKYLPIIESRLQPVARSYAGAVGLWQFISSTGKMYGLQMNSSVDERSDTYKASEAAARLLSELYKYYGDWALALASYNCGPGRVNRAIKDAGTSDYWIVRNYLPTETQKYVPYFMAVAYIGEFYEVHELEPMEHAQDLVLTDTIMTYTSKSLYQLAQDLKMNVDTLRRLNPGYLKGYVPTNSKGSVIVLPNRIVAKLRGYEDQLNAILSEHTDNPIKAIRRVNTAEELAFLMKAHRCQPRDIAAWNNLPADYTPQPGDIIAFRKHKPAAHVELETRREIENISIASLQVVGLDKKTKAMTAPVYASVHPSFATTSMVAMMVPQKVTNTPTTTSSSDLPHTPTASAMTAASMHHVSEPISAVQTMESGTEASDLSDRSRDRRVRGAAPAVVSTTTTSTQPAVAAQVPVPTSQEENTLVLATQQAETLVKTQQQAEANLQMQIEKQTQTQLADQLGKQATQAIAARQTAPASSENVATDNVVMGIVPVATSNPEPAVSADRSRERNLRTANSTVENMPIVAVSNETTDDGYIYYEVKEKETLWDVCKRYPGLTVRELMDLNALRSETDLHTGKLLKVRQK